MFVVQQEEDIFAVKKILLESLPNCSLCDGRMTCFSQGMVVISTFLSQREEDFSGTFIRCKCQKKEPGTVGHKADSD